MIPKILLRDFLTKRSLLCKPTEEGNTKSLTLSFNALAFHITFRVPMLTNKMALLKEITDT
jgi:hypothetical protein